MSSIRLEKGQNFALDIDLPEDAGDTTQVGITYKPLPKEVKPGSKLLLDDAFIVW